jgi:hypothetical protein
MKEILLRQNPTAISSPSFWCIVITVVGNFRRALVDKSGMIEIRWWNTIYKNGSGARFALCAYHTRINDKK